MSRAVRTVEGDVPGRELGVCDARDHLFLRTPRLPGRELADMEAAERDVSGFAAHGGGALVQWTPYGMGRRAGALVELARRTGVRLVAATGLHRVAHYVTELPRDPAALFVEELTRGVRGAVCGEAPRAGLVMVAGDPGGPGGYVRRTMRAAAEAHHATGAPVAVHLEGGSGAPDVLALLCGELGVPPASLVLGHLGRSPDPWAYREVARSGAWLAFGAPSHAHRATDRRLLDHLRALADAGHAGQLLVGGGTMTPAARDEAGASCVTRVLRPRITRECGEELARAVFVQNPARALAAEWRE